MLKLGIVGYGIMGERMLRSALEQAADTVAVSGVWDPSVAAMQRLSATFPNIPHSPEVETLIAGADCVYIASPPAAHLQHAEAALAAGKSVLCEKPLATDVAAAREFVTRHRTALAAVNFPFASSFAVERMRRWIAEGVIGTPRALTIDVAFARWPRGWQHDAAGWLDGRAEGGFTREVVSHFLFLARRMLGRLVLQSASVTWPEGGGSERAIQATLTAGNVTVTLTGSVGTTEQDDSSVWQLHGMNGAVRLVDWSNAEYLLPDGSWRRDPQAIPNERLRPLTLKRQLLGVQRMTDGDLHHLATLQEALDVQMIVEAILQS